MKEFCSHPGELTHTIDSRRYEGFTRRRYECSRCGERFTTVEVRVEMPPRACRKGKHNVFDYLRAELFTPEQRKALSELGKIVDVMDIADGRATGRKRIDRGT